MITVKIFGKKDRQLFIEYGAGDTKDLFGPIEIDVNQDNISLSKDLTALFNQALGVLFMDYK